ncbi:MAG: lysylphosphatidylglycerol synthase transmembrane domain-containing protein [Promethearchaeota archaeon]
MRSRIYYLVAFVSLVLIIIWLHIALLAEGGLLAIAKILLSANLFWLIPAFGLFGVSYVLRAIRWWLLLRPFDTKGNPANLFPILVGGIFLTYVVPLRAGDIATPYWLRETKGTRFTAGLSSILLARLLDFASLILIVVIFAALIFGSITGVIGYAIIGILIAAVFAIFFLLIRNERLVNFLASLLSRLFKPSKRLSEGISNFVENFAIDTREVIGNRNTGLAFLLSIPLWILETAKLAFLGLAIGVNLNFLVSCFVASISYMGGHASGIFIPAGIGIFLIQNIAFQWFSAVGLTSAEIASIALLDGLVYVIGLTILGVPSIATMGRGYRTLQDSEENAAEE